MFPNYNKTKRQYITPKIILEEILEEQGLLRNSWDQSVDAGGGDVITDPNDPPYTEEEAKRRFNGNNVVMEFEGGDPITGY